MEVTEFGEPYRHWLIGRCVPGDVADAAAGSVPAADDPNWVRYVNDFEQKWATRILPAPWVQLFAALNAPEFARRLGELTGVENLRPDPTLHGAGLHLSLPGSWLCPHLDSAIGPAGERRVNLVLYLNVAWRPEWGGATELCDMDGRPVRRIAPAFNHALVWCPGDETMHGVGETTTAAPCRLTAACYYWADPRPGATRRRALFCPRRP